MIPVISISSYQTLPSEFYEVIAPTAIINPYWILFNQELANTFLPSSSNDKESLAILAGNYVPNHLQTLALAYSGHQFGYFVPLLGDGRALLLGELSDQHGKHWDIQLKGSGKTMFSRMGDGRAPLTAVLREYLISEAMHGLNIPTTRCLAVIGCDEKIYRAEGLVPAGILTRIASSYLRVGSFEYAAILKSKQAIQSLADYALARHFPHLLEKESPYLELFKEIMDRQAYLITEWMGVGFIHGVMNTDNMSITGETIDYGPCAFMDEFDFNSVYSSIDTMGRYAFGNQATIAQWNLGKLHQALLPLFAEDPKTLGQSEEILNSFSARFHYYWKKKIRMKLGLLHETEALTALINQFMCLLQEAKPDYTNTFRLLSSAMNSELIQKQLIKILGDSPDSQQWVTNWLYAIQQQNIPFTELKKKMNKVNPAYIPRNHLIEKALNQFVENNDRTLIDRLLTVMKNPYHQQKHTEDLQSPPSTGERVCQTFCGT